MLPHPRMQKVEELFGEEILGGHFSVVDKSGLLLVDGLPLSRPIDMNAGSDWRMTYDRAVFDCKVTLRIGADFRIRCDSNKVALYQQFNAHRGFTSYQDFCGAELCAYHFESSVGLLSPYHVRLLKARPDDSPERSPRKRQTPEV